MVRLIAKQYLEEIVLDEHLAPPAVHTVAFIPQVAIQELSKCFHAGSSAIGSKSMRKWTYSIGQVTIKFYERDITLDQVTTEIHRLVSTVPE